MTEKEKIAYIDRGANYYLSLFGRAEHMERVDRECYSFVRPKGDVHGIRFVFDLRLEGLPEEKQRKLIAEIKALGMPVWLNLGSSDQVFQLYTGRKREPPQEPVPDEEEYLTMLPEEKPEYPEPVLDRCPVHTQEQFASWADIANRVLANGNPDVHPVYHYRLCQEGALRCYMGCQDGKAVSVAAAAWDGEAVSLEFVATLAEARRQGFARELCRWAVEEAFQDGARIVTVRAIDGRAAALYRSVGFRRCKV